MNQKLKHLSRIQDEFDTVICGINGVLLNGDVVVDSAIEALIKLYQSGKKIMLASNSARRVENMYYFLKKKDIPMNIFHAMITAGEIVHFYLKNQHTLGNSYFSLNHRDTMITNGLAYQRVESIVMADFLLAETDENGIDLNEEMPLLEQALHLRLPLLGVGNNTTLMGNQKVVAGTGAVAEQYAMLGGEVMSFGKPDVRLAAYLTENIENFKADRCLNIGDCMATDMRMANSFGAKTMLITDGIHQIKNAENQELNDLSESYGLNIDYYMEKLQW